MLKDQKKDKRRRRQKWKGQKQAGRSETKAGRPECGEQELPIGGGHSRQEGREKEERTKFQVKPSLPPLEIRGSRSQCHRCHLLGHVTLSRKTETHSCRGCPRHLVLRLMDQETPLGISQPSISKQESLFSSPHTPWAPHCHFSRHSHL